MALKKCTECGHEVSTKAKKCPNCGAPVPVDTNPVALAVSSVIVLAVVLFVCSGGLGKCSDGGSSSTSWQDRADEIAAYVMAEEFVKRRLKSPSTAEFPGVFDGRHEHVTYLGNQTYRIRSWVDAQNALGGVVRSDFTIELKQVSRDEWELVSLDMQQRW